MATANGSRVYCLYHELWDFCRRRGSRKVCSRECCNYCCINYLHVFTVLLRMHKSFRSVFPWNTATLKQQKIGITFMNISCVSGDRAEGLQPSPISMESLKMLSIKNCICSQHCPKKHLYGIRIKPSSK